MANKEKKVLIRVENLKQYFPVKKASIFKSEQLYVRANEDITLEIYEGETFGLVGESGCGKSTLGRTMLMLNKPTEGRIMYYGYKGYEDKGINLAELSEEEMRKLRKDLQLIFQDPYSSLNPRLTVGQIISEGMFAHKMFDKKDDKVQDYILETMNKCGLAPYFLHRYPHQFSGGQRQRIGIARSVALKPKFIVCDEAVSALDVSIQSQIINLLLDLKEKEDLTYMFISHDLSVIKYISDRVGVMYLGNIVELAETKELYSRPMHPYTEALLSAIPTTDEDGGNIEVLEGDIPSPIRPPSGCKFHTRCKYATDICKKVQPEFEEARPGHFVACHHKLNSEQESIVTIIRSKDN